MEEVSERSQSSIRMLLREWNVYFIINSMYDSQNNPRHYGIQNKDYTDSNPQGD